MKNEAIVALVAILIAASGVAGFLLGSASTGTTTTTSIQASSTTLTQTTTTAVGTGAESEALGTSGIELSLAINSTVIGPNGTISVTVEEVNTLPVAVNLSVSSQWMVQGLDWGCGRGDLPNGIGVLKGYYALDNVTEGLLLALWAPIPCIVPQVFNVTSGVHGSLLNVTNYSFLPSSDKASYSVFCVCSENVTRGVFGPDRMSMSGVAIHATDSFLPNYVNWLGSDLPATYTIVAGDEWGNIVLLHFSVVE